MVINHEKRASTQSSGTDPFALRAKRGSMGRRASKALRTGTQFDRTSFPRKKNFVRHAPSSMKSNSKTYFITEGDE